MSIARPPHGRNLPSLAELLAPQTIQAILEAEVDELRGRAAVLQASVVRFLQAHTEITDDEQDAIAAEVLATLQRFSSGRVETARVALKAPILAASRAVDQAFREIAPELSIRPLRDRTPPLNLAESIVERSVAYKTKKDRIARAAAEAAANRLAEEARTAELLADKGSPTVSYADATAAAERAERAQAEAQAKPAERTRTRGSDFGTTSLHKRRVFTITQPAAVPRDLCEPSETLIRRVIGKAGDPIPTIAGISIRDIDDLTVRR